MTKVLIVATSKYTRGGITAVIKQHQKGEQWKKFHCTWIGYHIDRSAALKLFFMSSINKICCSSAFFSDSAFSI